MSRLGQTIPALPLRDAASVDFYRERLGFDADFGTREFATLDRDRNLISFFQRVAR